MTTPRDSERFSRVKLPRGGAQESGERRQGKLTAGVPLGKFIRPRLDPAEDLVVASRPNSEPAKRFKELCGLLDDLRPEPQRTTVITSAADGEGKSLAAMNLALALAAREQGDVLLLDADLRRPSIGQRIAPAPKVGLAELLRGRTELAHALLELANSPLRILPAGEPFRDPLELLASDSFEKLMAALKERFPRIVIDTPPIVAFTDADLAARFSDGVLVVARAAQTRRGELMQAIASVTSAPVLGVLLNDRVG